MPVQKFAPMTKTFPTFDCDAHVAEAPKRSIWFDPDSKQLVVNGVANSGLGSQRIHGAPGMVNVLSLAGPGLKHDIQRAINVRNLNPKTALTAEQADYIDHKG